MEMTPLELQRRHKICQVCNVEYCDITKRFVGNTCSQKCASNLMVAKRHGNGSYVRTEAQNQKTSDTLKRQYALGERMPTTDAMLAAAWTPERVAKQQATSIVHLGVAHWSQTEDGRKLISRTHTGKTIAQWHRKKVSEAAKKRLQTENQYSRCKKGKRADLENIFFRSSWEANYARILNHLGVGWKYEPETFDVGEAETYTPDFKLADGTFVEIKGWWTKTGQRKVDLFRRNYPTIRLQTITRTEYAALSKQYRHLINHWE